MFPGDMNLTGKYVICEKGTVNKLISPIPCYSLNVIFKIDKK